MTWTVGELKQLIEASLNDKLSRLGLHLIKAGVMPVPTAQSGEEVRERAEALVCKGLRMQVGIEIGNFIAKEMESPVTIRNETGED